MADRTVEVYRVQELESVLDSLYGTSVEGATERYANLINDFKNKYGVAPEYIGRSPGRVNIVGEHIDYEGYSVLPMAIRQDTIVAIGRASDLNVHVATLAPGLTEEEFTIDAERIGVALHTWVDYVKAAYIGVCKHLQRNSSTGLNLLIEGQVPQGSGLSSSAALVCATALAILGLLGETVLQAEVAQFTAECEKFVGTESGGMDQAISIMGELGKAKLVHFNPIRTEDAPLPKGASFVIANSLAVSKKAEGAARQYNMRVVECRLAAAVLGVKLGLEPAEAVKLQTLQKVEGDVRAAQSKLLAGPKGSVTGAEAEVVKKYLDKEKYTQAELEQLLGVELEKMFEGNNNQLESVGIGCKETGFNLRDRAVHVYSEAARVVDFKAICDSEAKQDDEPKKLDKLATLMNQSHASCRYEYDCSCEELNHLVEASINAGALGSRLTGAGWGGCTVSLVPEGKVESFIAEVKQNYYMAKLEAKKLSQKDFKEDGKGGWEPVVGWKNVIFASPPGSGGAILDLTKFAS